ncbi:MAG: DUF1624 domain-containing protein [Oscillospiraceae bacterium]|nr:DUF1624 domain-containing protein [Oscillospiraceae bacterium]
MAGAPEQNADRPRYPLLDELRGLAILFMVIYHGLYLLAYVFKTPSGRMLLAYARPAQPFIAGTFFLICGICCRFSRSNGRRGLRLLGVALLVTLCTWGLTLFGFDELIRFGVLHFLAAAILLFALAQKPLAKAPPLPQFLLFALLFLVTAGPVYGGPAGIGLGRFLLPFPPTDFFPLFLLGFPSDTLVSADYFPLLPWLFLFFAGTALGAYGQRGRFPAFFMKSHSRALQWLGRHSLPIYLAHQPLLFAIFWILPRIFG